MTVELLPSDSDSEISIFFFDSCFLDFLTDLVPFLSFAGFDSALVPSDFDFFGFLVFCGLADPPLINKVN